MIEFKAIPRQWFFDREKVEAMMDRSTRKALSRFGAYVMTSAKRSMRPGGKKGASSAPGEPPRYHTRGIRDHIYFAYDPKGTVVIGPLKFNQKPSAISPVTLPTVPALHEYGGMAVRKLKGGGRRLMRYPARPFMQPAFEKEQDNLPRIWAQAAA